MTPIPPVSPPGSPSTSLPGLAGKDTGPTFGQVLEGAVHEVLNAQAQADALTASFAMGGGVPLDQVMAAVSQAEILTEASVAVVSRALQAYQTLMQTNIG